MNKPVKRLATYQDILALPENLVGEILAGRPHTHPRPAPKHARSASALTGSLWNPFDGGIGGPGGWWIIDEPELPLGEDIVVPDLAGWRRERMPELPDTAWFELAPDWVCEILSRSTASIDRSLKLPLYARESVPHLWLVDPDLQTLEVYRLEGDKWLLLSTLREYQAVRQPPFHAVEFSLQVLWG